MIFLSMLFRRAPWQVRIVVLAVIFLVFVTTVVRVSKATRNLQERNLHAHTRSSAR